MSAAAVSAVAAGAYVVSSSIKADQVVASSIQSQIKTARDLGVPQGKINAVLDTDYGSGFDGLTDFAHNNRIISLGLESLIAKQQKELPASTSSGKMARSTVSACAEVSSKASKPKVLSTPIPPVDNSRNVEVFPEASGSSRGFNLPGFTAYSGSWRDSNLPGFVAHEQSWQDSIFERSKSKAAKPEAQEENVGVKVPSGGAPDPDDEEGGNERDGSKEPEVTDFKTSNFKIGDNIGLHRFTIRFEKTKIRDPKTGQYIKKDRGINSGVGSHGGSYWKLFESEKGKQIGTITQDRYWLRK